MSDHEKREGQYFCKRCKSTTKKGCRCSKNTARAQRCWIHEKNNKGLRITGDPLELIAAKPFKKGKEIDEFKGSHIDKNEVDRLREGGETKYVVKVAENDYINSYKTSSCAARFAKNTEDPNAKKKVDHGKAKLVAKKNIRAGEKITKKKENLRARAPEREPRAESPYVSPSPPQITTPVRGRSSSPQPSPEPYNDEQDPLAYATYTNDAQLKYRRGPDPSNVRQLLGFLGNLIMADDFGAETAELINTRFLNRYGFMLNGREIGPDVHARAIQRGVALDMYEILPRAPPPPENIFEDLDDSFLPDVTEDFPEDVNDNDNDEEATFAKGWQWQELPPRRTENETMQHSLMDIDLNHMRSRIDEFIDDIVNGNVENDRMIQNRWEDILQLAYEMQHLLNDQPYHHMYGVSLERIIDFIFEEWHEDENVKRFKEIGSARPR